MATPAPASGSDRIDVTAAMYAAMQKDLQQIKDPVVLHTRINALVAERDALKSQLAAANKTHEMRASLAQSTQSTQELNESYLKTENKRLVKVITRLQIIALSLLGALVAVGGYCYRNGFGCKNPADG